jgi:hypothetical protein
MPNALVATTTFAGVAPGGARAAAMWRCLACVDAHRMTPKERLGRSKPVDTRTGSRRPRRLAMSLATCGVAVAVEAMIASACSQRAASARRK